MISLDSHASMECIHFVWCHAKLGGEIALTCGALWQLVAGGEISRVCRGRGCCSVLLAGWLSESSSTTEATSLQSFTSPWLSRVTEWRQLEIFLLTPLSVMASLTKVGRPFQPVKMYIVESVCTSTPQPPAALRTLHFMGGPLSHEQWGHQARCLRVSQGHVLLRTHCYSQILQSISKDQCSLMLLGDQVSRAKPANVI